MTQRLTSLMLAGAFLIAGCDSSGPFDRYGEVVVEAYLVADSSLGPVRLSRTQPVEAQYDFTPSAVRSALVRVSRLDATGTAAETISYSEDPKQPGVYFADDGTRVQPLATYELRVDVPSTGEMIHARTLVPGTYNIVDPGRDTLTYQGPEQAEILVTRSEYPRRQAIFVFSTEALDPSFDNLTPFYRDVVDPGPDSDVSDLQDYLINESPPFNEEGYEDVGGGVLLIKVPWLAFAFYGGNLLRSNALDDNLFDFVRSQDVQQGGSTFAPGEIPNIIDHVDGGTGVFGSYAVVETTVYVTRGDAADR